MRRIGTPNDMGIVLQDIRKVKKLTQKQVADASGLRQATISDLERNAENAQINTLFKTIAALGLDLYIADKKQKGDVDAGNQPAVSDKNSDEAW
jgi:HTH-type transcriptional regulator / antitoxin HipB